MSNTGQAPGHIHISPFIDLKADKKRRNHAVKHGLHHLNINHYKPRPLSLSLLRLLSLS